MEENKRKRIGIGAGTAGNSSLPSSKYLIACGETERQARQHLLYEVLGPLFFGREKAETRQELDELFRQQYGIDVTGDFCEGDDHYEEYAEACQAIAEGLAVYGGEIIFEDGILAELAEELWMQSEEQGPGRFRRINTLLEE